MPGLVSRLRDRRAQAGRATSKRTTVGGDNNSHRGMGVQARQTSARCRRPIASGLRRENVRCYTGTIGREREAVANG